MMMMMINEVNTMTTKLFAFVVKNWPKSIFTNTILVKKNVNLDRTFLAYISKIVMVIYYFITRHN